MAPTASLVLTICAITLPWLGAEAEREGGLNTTERTVYRIIKQLKEIGCPIYFDKARKSYCYQCKGGMIFKFDQHNTDNKALNGYGGVFRKTTLSFFQTDTRCQWQYLLLHMIFIV